MVTRCEPTGLCISLKDREIRNPQELISFAAQVQFGGNLISQPAKKREDVIGPSRGNEEIPLGKTECFDYTPINEFTYTPAAFVLYLCPKNTG